MKNKSDIPHSTLEQILSQIDMCIYLQKETNFYHKMLYTFIEENVDKSIEKLKPYLIELYGSGEFYWSIDYNNSIFIEIEIYEYSYSYQPETIEKISIPIEVFLYSNKLDEYITELVQKIDQKEKDEIANIEKKKQDKIKELTESLERLKNESPIS